MGLIRSVFSCGAVRLTTLRPAGQFFLYDLLKALTHTTPGDLAEYLDVLATLHIDPP